MYIGLSLDITHELDVSSRYDGCVRETRWRGVEVKGEREDKGEE